MRLKTSRLSLALAVFLLAGGTAASADEPAPAVGALTLETSPSVRFFRALTPAASDTSGLRLSERSLACSDRTLSDSFARDDVPRAAHLPARFAWMLSAPAATDALPPVPASDPAATPWDFSPPVVAPASASDAHDPLAAPAHKATADVALPSLAVSVLPVARIRREASDPFASDFWDARPPVGRQTGVLSRSGGAASGMASTGPQPAAFTPSGAARAWGNNASGQICDGTSGTANNRTSPTAVLNLTSGVAGMAAGGGHSLAVTSGGNVYAWGSNQFGQLGITTNSGTGTATSTPTLVAGLSNVTALAGGRFHSLAVTSAGQVYAFGNNQYGQLGNTTNLNVITVANSTPTLVAGLSNVTGVAGGQFHSLALTSGGSVYGFGLNNYGQLGTTTNSGTFTATPTPTLVTGLSNATAIAAGQDFSLALMGTGQVYAFGYNRYGQLGTTTNSGTTNANPTPTLVAGLPSVAGVAAGGNFSLAVTSGGNVFAWGYNGNGQLGNGSSGSTAANPTPYEVQYQGANLAGIVQVAAGVESSYALARDGSLYVWGLNDQGQLGLGTTTTLYTTPQRLVPPSGQYYQFIEADGNGSFALAILGSTPVPEPATWLAGALLLAATGRTVRLRGAAGRLRFAGDRPSRRPFVLRVPYCRPFRYPPFVRRPALSSVSPPPPPTISA